MLSYSGPSPEASPVEVRRAQPMPHPRQAARRWRKSRRNDSPEMAAACSNCEARKFRVGRTPAWFRTFTSTAVPNSGSACDVIGFALRSFSAS